MAGARYWRIYGLAPYGVGDLALTELGLYEAGVRVDTGAMLTATVAPTAGDISALSDGGSAITCTWSSLRYSMVGFALVYDLGVDRDIGEVRVGTGPSRVVSCREFSVQSSSDGVAWQTAFTTSTSPWPGVNTLASCMVDPVVYGKTVFLIRGRGTSIRDESPLRTPIAGGIGSFVISSARAIYGPTSVYANGGVVAYMDPLPQFNLSSEDFTLDGWYYRTSNSVSTHIYGGILSKRWGGADWDWGLEFNATQLGFRFGDSAGGNHWMLCGESLLNAWQHYRVCRQGNQLYGFLNGTLGGTATISGTIRNRGSDTYVTYGRTIMNYWDNWFQGYLYDVRLVRGIALNTSSFVIPGDTVLPVATDATPFGSTQPAPQLASPYTPPGFGVNYKPMVRIGHRLDFRGDGFIHDTVKRKGDPNNLPVRRKVLCMDMLTSTVVDETWSDATTGEYTFLYLDRARKYTVLSYDHSQAYRAAIADQLAPEKML